MIGYSLSLCIKDVIDGTVPEEAIERLVTGTCARTDEDWTQVIESYRRDYWEKAPDRAEKLVRRLLAEGKITQPRLMGGAPAYLGDGHWDTPVPKPRPLDSPRPNGFYWVRFKGAKLGPVRPPQIAEYDEDTDTPGRYWYVTGVDEVFDDSVLEVISGPLIPPGEEA